MRNGSVKQGALAAYGDVFSLLGVDATKPLWLKALMSVFYESENDNEDKPEQVNLKWYMPSELNSKHICLPDQDQEPNVLSYKIKNEQFVVEDLVLLERAGTFIATSAKPSLPLFDLFKTAAALHDCLVSGTPPDQCLLVGCDFSGIQDTVYTITSKGALKTLRARSFMLELLCEHIIHEIISLAESGRHAVVYSGGGGFGLLLPNNEVTVEKIRIYSAKLNAWALDEFSGRLFIAIDAMPFGLEKLGSQADYKDLRQAQADNLDRLKRRKFIDHLPDLFTPAMPEQLTVASECQITRRDDLKKKQMLDLSGVRMSDSKVTNPEDGQWTWVSESCFHQFWLGNKLVDAEKIYRYRNVIDRSTTSNYGTLVLPDKDGKDVFYSAQWLSGLQPELTWKINAWDEGPVILYANYVRKHGDLSVYARKQENDSLKDEMRSAEPEDTATFQGLASSSCGADLIGALRMDVDNLGELFSSIGNIGELSARSRMLNLFFKVYLNQICKEREIDILKKSEAEGDAWGKPGRNVSIVYAGGDDLFIVGAWDDTVELVFDIQLAFERFTYGRPPKDGGISGGLTLHQPKFPLYQMARLSAEAETYAKHDDDGDGQPQKNRVVLFFDHSKRQRKIRIGQRGREYRNRYMLSMTWVMAHDFLLPLMKIYTACGKLNGDANERKYFSVDKFSFATIEKWFAVIEKYQQSNQLYLPTMARVMRSIEHGFGNDRNDTALFEELVACLYTTEQGKQNWISHFHIALNWLAYLRRTA